MGDRGEIRIDESGVTLYSHWFGTKLPELLAEALSREERWNDPSYLTRIIFDEMSEYDGGNDATGLGIQDYHQGDVHKVIEVNCAEETVTTRDYNQDSEEYGFNEFIEKFREEDEEGDSGSE